MADFTNVSTWADWTYVAFVIDTYARGILGWRAATTMTAELVLSTLSSARSGSASGRTGLTSPP